MSCWLWGYQFNKNLGNQQKLESISTTHFLHKTRFFWMYHIFLKKRFLVKETRHCFSSSIDVWTFYGYARFALHGYLGNVHIGYHSYSDFTLASLTTVMLTHSCTLLYCCKFVSYLKMHWWTNSTNFAYLHPVVECMIIGIAYLLHFHFYFKKSSVDLRLISIVKRFYLISLQKTVSFFHVNLMYASLFIE